MAVLHKPPTSDRQTKMLRVSKKLSSFPFTRMTHLIVGKLVVFEGGLKLEELPFKEL